MHFANGSGSICVMHSKELSEPLAIEIFAVA